MAVLLGVLVGALLPIQAGVNARLRAAVVSPFVMSTISFIIGTFFLAILTLTVDGSLTFASATFTEQPAWIWLGGVFGVIAMTTNVLLVPRIGAVQAAVIPMSGQILMGVLIDHFGWFSVQQAELTWTRILGVLLMLAGALGTVLLGKRRTTAGAASGSQIQEPEPALWFWRGAGLLAGVLFAMQAAVNGHLGEVIGSSVKAALVSFTVGVILLLLILAVQRPKLQLVRAKTTDDAGKTRTHPHPWWMWFGGILGSLYVLGNAFLVPQIGAGATIVAVLLGMMSCSLLVDHFGLLGVPRKPVAVAQLLTLLVMLGGVVLVRLV